MLQRTCSRVALLNLAQSEFRDRFTMLTRRQAVSGALAAAVALPRAASSEQRLVLNDASGLSPTPVFSHWIARTEPQDAIIARLRAELAECARLKRPFAVGAARHSMGGQSLPRNGTAVTLDIDSVEPDSANKIYRVHAGTRWRQVIAALDPIDFSPAVMQSNADFGVGATFCVNAHGWPTPFGPFGSTVKSFRMMLATGDIVTCSREENAELFGLAMGGYGLFGILLDLDVEMVENETMRPTFEVMPATYFAERFMRAAKDPDVKMMYGRLNVAHADFLGEALLVTLRLDEYPMRNKSAQSRGALSTISRELYRAQIGSEAGKRARWLAETTIAPRLLGKATATRNRLMNEPVANLAGDDRRRADILHEYFVAPERFGDFLAACRDIIPPARAEFLNVTLRHVRKDEISALTYATTDRIAAVMSFSQEVSPEGEADMMRMTEALIDRVAAIGGAYYLPYRLHARQDQFERVYPGFRRFSARKRHYDPQLIFRNALWDAYFAG